MADIIKKQINNAVTLYYIPDTKYKTVSASAYLNRKLKKVSTISLYTLIKVSKNYNGTIFSKFLEKNLSFI